MLLFSLTRPRRFFLVFSLLAMFAVAVVLPGDLTLATRLSSVGDESALERLTIQLDAFEQFLEMPWFGSAYEELRSDFIRTILTLESALALEILDCRVDSGLTSVVLPMHGV